MIVLTHLLMQAALKAVSYTHLDVYKRQTYIRATIYCERDSQKGIIIGKKGALLKQLGAEARVDIQKLLATKVYLDLWVKVKKDWRNKSGMLSELGYRK